MTQVLPVEIQGKGDKYETPGTHEYNARRLVNTLFLYLRLVGMTKQADRRGELHKDHKLLRITKKARSRYLRVRSQFQEKHCDG